LIGRAGYLLGGEPRCLWCALRYRPLLKRSTLTALVVGTILVSINQGGILLSGALPASLLWQIPLTYLVPFCVATWGALSNTRLDRNRAPHMLMQEEPTMPPTDDPSSEEAPFFTGDMSVGRVGVRYDASPDSIAPHGFLTPQDRFAVVERGNPLPYTLPPARRREVGLEPDTWQLEIVADPESDSKIEQPLSKELGTALDFDTLLKLGEVHGVQFMKALSCNNLGEPLGMGLWEGVPLRVLIWMTRPVENIRRVFYYGYHNDDPAQIFQSSLPIGRVLEDPPGELPVIVCYRLNGEPISGKRGGPVRMVVPEAYGFKSVKWLQRVVLTNAYQSNDTYAQGNNDLDSPMKTFARFARVPPTMSAGTPIRISGVAQVGVSGLATVQYSLQRQDAPLPADDPTFSGADWQDAEIVPPPARWGGDLPDGRLPGTPLQFDAETGTPTHWPLRYAVAHWQADLGEVAPGRYVVRCRTIDANGIAQPMPRPFAKGGRAAIQEETLVVEG
jgi:DMSO/TMAO reductase YedYZ molybdopterin-dependent catalytic subunit